MDISGSGLKWTSEFDTQFWISPPRGVLSIHSNGFNSHPQGLRCQELLHIPSGSDTQIVNILHSSVVPPKYCSRCVMIGFIFKTSMKRTFICRFVCQYSTHLVILDKITMFLKVGQWCIFWVNVFIVNKNKKNNNRKLWKITPLDHGGPEIKCTYFHRNCWKKIA